MNLSSTDFADFFRAIHGYEPFPWQQRLADQLDNKNKWPDVLDLPTGAGKTTTLDIAVFHLALRYEDPKKAALRIVLVVDRRLVVDNAFDHAEKIASVLNDPKHKVVKEIASRLKRLAGDDAIPLLTKKLRGGIPLEHDWARTPTQPTILCSTVDQVGSRLLFRGYGVSDRMKPVHAGLLGTDSLILLDEAHLSEPFRKTLDAVQDEKIGKADIKTVLLSATPDDSEEQKKHFFRLKLADRKHPVLKNRLKSPKPSTLRTANAAKAAKSFAESAQKIAKQLLEANIKAPAVGVVVNRVELARDIFKELKKARMPEADTQPDVQLMIGRSRSIDRDEIAKKLEPFLTDEARTGDTPLFIVATQCLEVGVDLDLDGLVTQAASLDALRQRFGRLNRAGRELSSGEWFPARGVILALPEDIKKTSDDFVYGNRIHLTWEKLNEIAEDGEVDFGIEALKETGISPADFSALSAPRTRAPTVMPAYLDLWSQTSPIPAADPEIGLFLHGAERASPEVSIVWRSDVSDLIKKREKGNLSELMKLVPPRAAETISVPLRAARAWLRKTKVDDIADVPASDDLTGPRESSGDGEPRQAFRWAGTDDPNTRIVGPDDLRVGDVLVVPTDYGGIATVPVVPLPKKGDVLGVPTDYEDCDEFGWAPASKDPVKDVADKAAVPFRAQRYAVRITPDVTHWNQLLPVLADESIESDDLPEKLFDALSSESDVTPDNEKADTQASRSVRKSLELRKSLDLRESIELLKDKGKNIVLHSPYTGDRDGGVVLVATNGLKDENGSAQDVADPSTEDDTLSVTSRAPVELNDHSEGVEDFVKRFTQTLGLEDEVRDDLCLAAFLHDAGKADRRFQVMLSGGDPWNYPDGEVLAKSAQKSYNRRGTGKRAGLPKGWRHEALSVRMAQAHPYFKDAHDPALVLWLIGTHHGYGRPFFRFTDPIEDTPEQELLPCLDVPEWQLEPGKTGPQLSTFEFNGADWPSLFERLKQKYGIWKLAHFEAIVRLADHRESEKERRRHE